MRSQAATRMAKDIAHGIGQEITLSRMNSGITVRAAARLAGVSHTTQRRIEDGDPSVGLDTLCQVASVIGLKVWARAFPARKPSLRDTGQLVLAERLRRETHRSLQFVLEYGLEDRRSVDVVIFGPSEVVAVEIYRLAADFQAQYRQAAAKREALSDRHQRPVRLVIALEDTRRNRTAVAEHAALIGSALPAGSREVLAAVRTGRPLGRDGLVWLRRDSVRRG